MSDSAIGFKKPNPLWQIYIQEGNVNMRDGLYSQAQTACARATKLAEELLTNALQKQDDADAINVFIISCQNLAEVYRVMGLTGLRHFFVQKTASKLYRSTVLRRDFTWTELKKISRAFKDFVQVSQAMLSDLQ